nr:MAG TPA: hypothetical protein [Caudoviricetes sp.]
MEYNLKMICGNTQNLFFIRKTPKRIKNIKILKSVLKLIK